MQSGRPVPVRGPRPWDDPERVVLAAAGGSEEAWNQLVRQYRSLVLSIARSHRLSEADVADVSQTTWLRLVEHMPSLRDARCVGAWLATTARRESLAVLRSRERETPTDHVSDAPDNRAPALDAALCAVEKRDTVQAAVSNLRRRDQMLLAMLMRDPQPSYELVSVRLGMPVGSIGPTRARALDRLREDLDQHRAALVLA